jgi:peptide-methionine (R)-S-oxide reductase
VLADAPKDDIARRRILFAVPAAMLAGAALLWRLSEPRAARAKVVTVVEFDDGEHRQQTVQRPQIARSDSEWRARLSSEQYWSTRRGTTDTPFTGTFYRSHDDGIYRCVCCGSALFSSRDKYDSGTGWPAYSAPLALENIWTKEDNSFGMHRTEVFCRLCDAHLGHVFDDGPPPVHLRYCINESALRFVPA